LGNSESPPDNKFGGNLSEIMRQLTILTNGILHFLLNKNSNKNVVGRFCFSLFPFLISEKQNDLLTVIAYAVCKEHHSLL
jgi:hypothetical protein